MQPTQEIAVIYASTSGNTEAVVEKVCSVWGEQGLKTSIHRAEQVDLETLDENTYFLLATSTWEHGVINPFFKPVFEALKERHLEGKLATFIGTGDTRYEPVLFCGGMNMLRERWLQQGGQEIGAPLKINGEPYQQLETRVSDWARAQAEKITQEMSKHTS